MTLDDFKLQIKYRLGYPVVNIELADEQFDLAIHEAITFYQRNHFDGSEQVYMPIQITEDIKTNRYVDLPEEVIGVNSLFDVSGSNSLFSVDFIMAADAAWSAFRGGNGLSSYFNIMSYRSLIQEMLASKVPVRFNYNRGKVFIDFAATRVAVGDWIVLDTTVAVDPNCDTRMFEDPWLNDFAEACVKRIWGQTLKKYQQVQMPGGIMLDGQTMFTEANETKSRLEEEVISKFQLPMNFIVG